MANKKPSAEQLAKFKEKFINDWWSEEDFYKKWVELWWINKDEEYEKSVPTLNYNSENKANNEEILRNIKYNSTISPEQKTKALIDLEKKSNDSINKRNENLPDETKEIEYIANKNKENKDIAKASRSSIYSNTSRLTYHAMTPDKDEKFMNEIKKIYANPEFTDDQKRKKIQYIVSKLENSESYIDNAYNNKYLNTNDWALSSDELAEKKMLIQYRDNFNKFKSKANKYIDALWWQKSQNWYNLGRDLFWNDDITKDLNKLW